MFSYLRQLFLFTFIGLMAIACDNSSTPLSPEGHTDAEGFVLENEAGTELYREFEGEIVTNNITLSVGDTLELAVHFLDHDGNEIEHEEGEDDHGHDEEEELRISGNDPAIATIEVEEHCDEITNQTDCETSEHCEWHSDESKCEDEAHEDHDEEEEHHGLVIHITGVSAGSTTFKLELWHGNHLDFTPVNNVSVTVNAQN